MPKLLSILLLTLFIAGCELVGDIFKAGIAAGVIIVVLVIALIAWLIRKMRGRP